MKARHNMMAGDLRRQVSALFPAAVAVSVAEDWMWEKPVSEQEEALFKGASTKRQQEFRAGRHCAHAALTTLGCTAATVLRGEKGEPLWPAGFCGTISHSKTMCAAAVARLQDVIALGMDIEQHEPLKNGVLAKIATATEIARLQTLRQTNPEIHYDVLLFSIKEAIYKAYFPLTRQGLGFHDVDVEIDVVARRFACRVLTPANAMTEIIDGHFSVSDSIVGAAVTIAAEGAGQVLAR